MSRRFCSEVAAFVTPTRRTPRSGCGPEVAVDSETELRVDGRPVDLVIGTKFPSYVVRHPNKVVWLVHQFRQAYELDRTALGTLAAGDRQASSPVPWTRVASQRTRSESTRSRASRTSATRSSGNWDGCRRSRRPG